MGGLTLGIRHSAGYILLLVLFITAACSATNETTTEAVSCQLIFPALSADITPPFTIIEEAGSLHGMCVSVPKGVGHGKEGSSGPVIDNGWADFTFDVQNPLTCELWARVHFMDSDSNSFFILIDGGDPEILADDIWNRWHWIRLPGNVSLGGGTHALRIRNREDGVMLDEVRFVPKDLDAQSILPLTFMERLQVMGKEAADAQMNDYFRRMTPVRPPRFTESREAWEAHRGRLRKTVLRDIGLDPVPEGVPIDPHVVATMKRDGYSVSRLYFQLFPGCYGSGWLYVPDRIDGKAPAILNPHGHWTHRAYDTQPQMRMIGLVKKGYIALMTDNIHAGDLETGMCPIGLMTWQNMRALDYLCSREDVDADRLGITGASGGGQQTMYMMGLDERLRAAVPVVMASYFERILSPDSWHCWCNHAPGIASDTDTIEILCGFAPKPALFICSSRDWTAKFPSEEYKEVKKVWGLYGAAGRIECIISDVPHGYGQERREAMYRFMNERLDVTDPEEGREPKITPETLETLQGMDKPFEGLWNWNKAKEWYRAHHRPSLSVEDIPPRLASLLRSRPPEESEAGGESKGVLDFNGGTMEPLLINGEGGLKLPALFIKSSFAEAKAPAVVLLRPEGKHACFADDGEPDSWVSILVDKGIHVLALDARLTGELYRNWERNCLIWGRPEAGMAADDARWAAGYLALRDDVDPARISVMGLGRMGVSALAAATLDDRFAACLFDDMERTYGRNPLHDAEGFYSGKKWLFELGLPVIPRILDVADLPEIAAACRAEVRVIPPEPESRELEGMADFLLQATSRQLNP